MRGLVSYLLVPRNPSWDFEAVRGNPVRLRNCPAAVSGNDIVIRTGSDHLGSDGEGARDASRGEPQGSTPTSPKTCQCTAAAVRPCPSPRGKAGSPRLAGLDPSVVASPVTLGILYREVDP